MNNMFKNEDEVKKFFEDKEKSNLLLKRGAAFAVGVVILGLTGTLLMSALTAGLALGALLAIGTVCLIGGVFVWKSFPRWVLSIENRVKEDIHKEMLLHLENLKKNVKVNPIEQMESQYIEQQGKLSAFKDSIKEFSAAIDSAKRNLDNSKTKFPATDFSKESEQITKMEEFREFKKTQRTEAQKALDVFKNKIDNAKAKWDFQLAANRAIALMNNSDKDSLMQDILTEVAFEEVHKANDALFASLEMDLASMDSYRVEIAKGLPSSNEAIIDVEVQNREVIDGR